MHQPILDGLEAYLAGKPSQELVEHLAVCAECRGMAEAITEQTKLVRTLRTPLESEPSPGFYGRVMERIEAQRPLSMWNILVEPLFAKRLVYASLALFVLLSGIFLSMPQADVHPGMTAMIADDQPIPAGDQLNRDAVLVQLSTWHGE